MFGIKIDDYREYGVFADVVDGNLQEMFYSPYDDNDEDSGGFVGIEKATKILEGIDSKLKLHWREPKAYPAPE